MFNNLSDKFYYLKLKLNLLYRKFDQSRGDAIAKKHVNGSRKFPLRL